MDNPPWQVEPPLLRGYALIASSYPLITIRRGAHIGARAPGVNEPGRGLKALGGLLSALIQNPEKRHLPAGPKNPLLPEQ